MSANPTEPAEHETDAGLVEPQGVNSASGVVDFEPDAGADVRSGGRPSESEQMEVTPSDREEKVGPPDQQGGGPGQELEVGEG